MKAVKVSLGPKSVKVVLSSHTPNSRNSILGPRKMIESDFNKICVVKKNRLRRKDQTEDFVLRESMRDRTLHPNPF